MINDNVKPLGKQKKMTKEQSKKYAVTMLTTIKAALNTGFYFGEHAHTLTSCHQFLDFMIKENGGNPYPTPEGQGA